jgi:hypothetical protein
MAPATGAGANLKVVIGAKHAEVGAGGVCAKEGVGGKAGVKNVFLRKFSVKAAGKRKFLTVDVDFGKIIDMEGRKLCFLRVYWGKVRLQEIENGGWK